MLQPLLQMNKIVKQFPGVRALNEVNFDLNPGEVHALLGENGAGKSTLIKILCGAYTKDAGEIWIDGREVHFKSTKDAQNAGIAVIYQEFNQFPILSVAENLFSGRLFSHKGTGFIDWPRVYQETRRMLEKVGLDIDPRTPVYKLTVAEQQMLEIAKALSIQAKILIMDEPTSALTEKEIQRLFETIRDLKKNGVAIIYISHRMEELQKIGDRATVLRDGVNVGTIDLTTKPIDELIKMMIGRNLEDKYPKVVAPLGINLVEVKDVATKKGLQNINLTLRQGEIIGVFGLLGSCRTQLARVIFGADPVSHGEIFIQDQQVKFCNPEDGIAKGIALLPEDRKRQGLVLAMSVGHNITLANLKRVSLTKKILHVIHHSKEQEIATELCSKLDIKTSKIKTKALNLSGGNQQKVVIAKWLCSNSRIFIFDEPTRGIDIGAKVGVYRLMNELVKDGAGIIMISSEMPEILGMSDRIIVLNKGRIAAELSRSEATQEKLMNYATIGRTKDE
jgi:ribose transport system ATP-binding protein